MTTIHQRELKGCLIDPGESELSGSQAKLTGLFSLSEKNALTQQLEDGEK